MRKDDTLTIQDQFAELSRLQLQALCVKAGLDSTADNEELKRILQVHRNQHQGQDRQEHEAVTQQKHIAMESPATTTIRTTTTMTMTETTADVMQDVTGTTDAMMEDATDAETTIRNAVQETITEVDTQAITTTTIKEEEEAVVVEGMLGHPLVESSSCVKSEEEDPVIKQEEDQAKASYKEMETGIPLSEVKVEETSVPIAERKQFWEARSTPTTRSALPVSSTSIPRATQKRTRPMEEDDGHVEVKKEEGQDDHSNTLPTPGTVRSLIGKFAGSTLTPPGSPANKRQKMDTPKSSPVPAAAPTIPRYKKIIKIPAAGSSRSKSPYTISSLNRSTNSSSSKSAAGARRKVHSDPASSTSANQSTPTPATAKKLGVAKPVSAETINRLATPKKVNAAPTHTAAKAVVASSSTAASSAPTRPRGPVLSTASRAAQRRSREKK
ncbi:hypothetical protein BC939DRAFT_502726 [Gamsiella multidivaricata]|uniref:uncharacterized protein n=1 Tax=Gamsiella multidivaricata TaxID=101098 RepID=UPI002220D313|nr:uncharacterized protein BC939DRAFT_502726 [Gamsiella multidivaricata]KAG0363077.1 hypothetical protein BGZ54_008356 [Gamsiella multidivaricata]KAI7824294.1 hypothetical protein BC939DRAFT_502726 [Gamsiella multidivaricata]